MALKKLRKEAVLFGKNRTFSCRLFN